jgi:4-diphosphocytidyl-2-C-methyl-D-erythritol kinase
LEERARAAMAVKIPSRRFSIPAFAKINLSLEIRGVRADGYHDLRTIYQTIELHDTLTFSRKAGAFEIRCGDPACPNDRSNLVWRAAELVWRAAGRRGQPEGVRVRIRKRIPIQAGLGGGSSDGAAALVACARLWRVPLGPARFARLARRLGADVPFFRDGGTAIGAGRGDRLRRLADWPSSWVVLLVPPFGVSTKEAYAWWDEDRKAPGPGGDNDLQAPVAARHPEIAEMATALARAGASSAAMSGSGSVVFGLFPTRSAAARAVRMLKGAPGRPILTRTLNQLEYGRRHRCERA